MADGLREHTFAEIVCCWLKAWARSGLQGLGCSDWCTVNRESWLFFNLKSLIADDFRFLYAQTRWCVICEFSTVLGNSRCLGSYGVFFDTRNRWHFEEGWSLRHHECWSWLTTHVARALLLQTMHATLGHRLPRIAYNLRRRHFLSWGNRSCATSAIHRRCSQLRQANSGLFMSFLPSLVIEDDSTPLNQLRQVSDISQGSCFRRNLSLLSLLERSKSLKLLDQTLTI